VFAASGTMRTLVPLAGIAHQPATVAMADHIAVLENGQVVKQGTPAQLRTRTQRQAAKGWRIAPAASVFTASGGVRP